MAWAGFARLLLVVALTRVNPLLPTRYTGSQVYRQIQVPLPLSFVVSHGSLHIQHC